ncbi:uncharacterized protein YcfJ [Sphingomonas sp. UYAg733]
MFKKFSLAAAALAMGTAALIPATPAAAHRHGGGYSDRYDNRDYRDDNRNYRNDDRRYRNDDRRYYNDNRRNYRDNRCDKGTGGTVIGAIAGGLLGHEIAGRRGDRTLGAVLGAGAGALAGRAIDRSDNPRYCR